MAEENGGDKVGILVKIKVCGMQSQGRRLNFSFGRKNSLDPYFVNFFFNFSFLNLYFRILSYPSELILTRNARSLSTWKSCCQLTDNLIATLTDV